MIFFQDPGEPAFAATDVEHAPVLQVAKMTQDELNVKDAGVDG
jgi:hypothetical protein